VETEPVSHPLRKGDDMPIVQVKVLKGVFDGSEKQEIISRVTDAMVSVEGEPLREFTWVTVEEIESGDVGIGGNPLTTDAVNDIRRAATAAAR
jgi:4-oxalocrotonate tautomerase